MIPHDVLLFGPLRDKFGSNKMTVEMPEKSTVEGLLQQLEINPDSVKVAVNGEIVQISEQLHSQSEIALLPPVSGG